MVTPRPFRPLSVPSCTGVRRLALLALAVGAAASACGHQADHDPPAPPAPPDDISTLGCGNAVLLARYPACHAAKTGLDCELAGGRWLTSPDGGPCLCPTGQERCRCDEQSDCLGQCVAPYDDCASAREGLCTDDDSPSSCRCYLGAKGTPPDHTCFVF